MKDILVRFTPSLMSHKTLEDIFVSLVDPGDSEDSVRAELSGELAGGAS